MKEFKVGDYVELIGNANHGIEVGEQGIVIDDRSQMSLVLMFPARNDLWADDRCGWCTRNAWLKLIKRFKEIKC